MVLINARLSIYARLKPRYVPIELLKLYLYGNIVNQITKTVHLKRNKKFSKTYKSIIVYLALKLN